LDVTGELIACVLIGKHLANMLSTGGAMPDDDGSLDPDDGLLLDPNEGGLTVLLSIVVAGLAAINAAALVTYASS
jgi:hypothetical protein